MNILIAAAIAAGVCTGPNTCNIERVPAPAPSVVITATDGIGVTAKLEGGQWVIRLFPCVQGECDF